MSSVRVGGTTGSNQRRTPPHSAVSTIQKLIIIINKVMFDLVTIYIIFDYNGNTVLHVLNKIKILSLQKKRPLQIKY